MFGPQLLIPPTLKTYKVISISCVIISAAAFFLVSSLPTRALFLHAVIGEESRNTTQDALRIGTPFLEAVAQLDVRNLNSRR